MSKQWPWAVIIGLILLAIGGYVWVAFSEGARECSSVLVSAADPGTCTSYASYHTGRGVAAIVGIVLIVITIVKS